MISPTSVTRDINLAMLLYLSCSTVKLEKADNWSGGFLTFMSRNQMIWVDSHMALYSGFLFDLSLIMDETCRCIIFKPGPQAQSVMSPDC